MGDRKLNPGDQLNVVGVKTFEKRCDGCRYWEVNVDDDGDKSYYGIDSPGLCRHPSKPFESCCGCSKIGTPADFGCVLWQAKEDSDG